MRVDTAHRRITALREEIYRAFTQPGLLAAWLPPEGMHGHLEHFDLRSGGGFRSVLTYETHDAPGKYSAHSDVTDTKIVTMESPRRVVWAVDFPSEDPAFSGTMYMEWTLEAVFGGTDVTVQAKDVPRGIRPEDHVAGLESSLAKLAGLFEHRRPVHPV